MILSPSIFSLTKAAGHLLEKDLFIKLLDLDMETLVDMLKTGYRCGISFSRLTKISLMIEAYTLVESFLPTSVNFAKAMAALKSRFGSKVLQIEVYVR